MSPSPSNPHPADFACADYQEDLPDYCASHVLQSPTMWLGIFVGGVFTVFLMLYRIKGAILIGIFLTSIISWPRPTAVTAFPHTSTGDEAFDFFKQVVTFWPLKRVGNALDVSGLELAGAGPITNAHTFSTVQLR